MSCAHVWTDISANRTDEWQCAICKTLYTDSKPSTAPKRHWESLTTREVSDILEDVRKQTAGNIYAAFARGIEAALKHKNT